MKKYLLIFFCFILVGLGTELINDHFFQSPTIKQVSISGHSSVWLETAYPVAFNENYAHSPVKINGQRFNNTILAHARSSLGFSLDKRSRYFRVKIGLDDGIGNKGKVRFLVYLDDLPIYISPVIQGGDAARSIVLDVGRGKLLELAVDPIGDNAYDQAVWAQPELIETIPKDEVITHPPAPFSTIKLTPSRSWDAGARNFPNRTGLLAWQAIITVFYLLVLILAVSKRKVIKTKLQLLVGLVNLPESYILVLCGLLSFWVFIPFWRSGLPAAWDAGAVYYRCLTMKNLFLCNFQLDGWSPYWYLGVQQFLFYSLLPSLVTVLLHFLTFQLVPLISIFKLVYFLIYFGLPYACYWLLRRLAIDPLPAALAALGVPAYSAIHGIGIQGLFTTGLFTQVFSLLLFCLALGYIIKPGRHPIMPGTLCALAYLAHTFTGIYLLLCLLVFTISNLRDREYLKAAVRLIVVGFCLTAFHLIPFIVHYLQGMSGPETGWGDVNLLPSLLTGDYLGPALINIIALTGFVLAFFSRQKNLVILAVIMLLTLGLSSVSGGSWFHFLPRQILQVRVLPFLAIFYVVFTGLSYQWFLKLVRPRMRERLFLALLLIVTISTVLKLHNLRPLVKLDTDFADPQRSGYLAAFKWLKENSPVNPVIGWDHSADLCGIGFIQMESRINILADRYTLGGNQLELTRANNSAIQEHLRDWMPIEISRTCRRFNVSYLLLQSEMASKNLAGRPDLFQPVFSRREIILWQVLGHDFRYLSNDNVSIESFFFSPELLHWRIQNMSAGNLVTAAVSYHPNWQLQINGQPRPLVETSDHLLSFTLPGKDAEYDVQLQFIRPLWQKGVGLFSCCCWLLAAFALVRPALIVKLGRRYYN